MDVWFNGRLTVTKVNTLISVRLDLSGLSRGETRFASLWKKTHRGKKNNIRKHQRMEICWCNLENRIPGRSRSWWCSVKFKSPRPWWSGALFVPRVTRSLRPKVFSCIQMQLEPQLARETWKLSTATWLIFLQFWPDSHWKCAVNFKVVFFTYWRTVTDLQCAANVAVNMYATEKLLLPVQRVPLSGQF